MLQVIRAAIMVAVCGGLLLLNASRSWAQTIERMEVGGEYSFVDTNAPPGQCGCFHMNGGAGWFAYDFSPRLAVVGEVGSAHASNIDSTAGDLTLTSFLAGPRYAWHRVRRIAPFGQILLGGAHAGGALTPASSGLAASANAFAMAAGGGVDMEVTRYWTLRLLQLDYYLTRFNNGGNDHQNNLRVGMGVAYRFGRGG